MIKSLKSFVANESGATAIEYALIASLIAVALVGILTSLGTKLSAEFSDISGALKEAARELSELTGKGRRSSASPAFSIFLRRRNSAQSSSAGLLMQYPR